MRSGHRLSCQHKTMLLFFQYIYILQQTTRQEKKGIPSTLPDTPNTK